MKKYLFSLALLTSSAFACAGGYDYLYVKDEYYNFMNSKMVNIEDNNPIYLLSASYSAQQDRVDFSQKLQKESNIKKWEKYFKNLLTYKEVNDLFYGKKNEWDDSNADFRNRYLKIEDKINNKNFDEYANFLIEQLPIADGSNTQNSEILIKKLIEKIKIEDKFLAQRYLFLAIRTLHYSQMYKEAIKLYEENIEVAKYDEKDGGLVYYWIYALVAGANQNLGDELKANIMYSQLVAKNALNAVVGYKDFSLKDENSWKKLLDSTKDDETKALYYFMRSMNWQNAPIKELENIAKIAPNSVWFEKLSFMVAQSLQSQRYSLMQEMANKSKYAQESEKSFGIQKNEYFKVLNMLQKPSFFTLYVKTYFDLLDYKEVDNKQIEEIKKLAKKDDLPYVEILNYLQELNKTDKLEKDKLDFLYEKLKTLLPSFDKTTQNSLLRYSALQISTLYPEASLDRLFLNNYAKSDYSSLTSTPNFTAPKDYLKYVNSQKPYLENEVFNIFKNNTSEDKQNELLMMLYMQQNDFENALKYKEQIKEINPENIQTIYNPFNNLINGNNRKDTKQPYSFEKFTKTMVDIQKALQTNPQSVMDNYLYGIGLYNKSWFGNFPMSSISYKSTTFVDDAKQNGELLDLSTKYLKTARDLTQDSELRAKIDYAILKNEFAKLMVEATQKEKYFWIPQYGDDSMTKELIDFLKKSPQFANMMKKYRTDYQNTKFGAEILDECITFKFF